jgi:hypothetical protein
VQDPEDPSSFLLYEQYVDKAALEPTVYTAFSGSHQDAINVPYGCHDLICHIAHVARSTNRLPFGEVWLRTDLEKLTASFQLSDEHRHFVSSRWLETVLWMEAAAQRTRTRYYSLRLTTVVGAVIVPALVSINAVGGTEAAITWLTFAVSLVVAVSVAIEGFLRFGDRWRHYRSLAEEMKSEGWDFYELSGLYRAEDHETAFPTFVERVDALLRREPQEYIEEIARPAQTKADSDEPPPPGQ